jgi:hypothetical protein
VRAAAFVIIADGCRPVSTLDRWAPRTAPHRTAAVTAARRLGKQRQRKGADAISTNTATPTAATADGYRMVLSGPGRPALSGFKTANSLVRAVHRLGFLVHSLRTIKPPRPLLTCCYVPATGS